MNSRMPMEAAAPVSGGIPARNAAKDLPAIAGGLPIRPAERRIVFGAPIIGQNDIDAVADCLRSLWIGAGPRVRRFEHEFARYKGAPFAAAVSSGTAAIHLALVALGIGPGDEVIAPAMTFCSTIHSIMHAGALPVLADCESATMSISPEDIERRITLRTKAILAVHMCGRCCDMDAILAIARQHRLYVVEDCAHAIESSWKGKAAGLMGDMGCFSFYATKNLTSGDGGMVVTASRRLFRRIKLLSLHGMVGDAWTRSVSPTAGYKVVEAGYKYNMTDVSAALGLSQLAELDRRWERRRQLWQMYNMELRNLPLQLPAPIEPDSRHACHLYSVLLDAGGLTARRDKVVAALRAENIGSGIHYVPIHRQPYYRRRFGFQPDDFPNARFVGERTLSLPLSPAMTDEDGLDVCAALRRILRYYAAGAA